MADLHVAELSPALCAELRALKPSDTKRFGSLTNVEVQDDEVLLKLWSHVQSHVPSSFEGLTLIGPHPRMRFLEYVAPESAEEDHPLHADTPLQDAGSCSYVTVLVYLNADFEGGELQFDSHLIRPKEGLLLVFPHRLLHKALALKRGTKQVLKLSVLYAEDLHLPKPGSCQEADMAERLPIVMAAQSAERRPHATAQAGYFQREPLWKHTLSMVGTKKDEFLELIQNAKKLNTDNALEKLLDFIVQHDVSSESWAEELLTSAFMSMAHALQSDRLKLKAYQALDSAKMLHGHELCVLLGETLMRDFDVGATLEIRLAALHAFLTLITADECRSNAVVKALNDPEAKIRLRALQGISTSPGAIYESALQSVVSRQASTQEVALAVQALAKLKASD